MKKLLCLALALMMVLALAACGGKRDAGNKKGPADTYQEALDVYFEYVSCAMSKEQYKNMFPAEYWEKNDFEEYWEEYQNMAELRSGILEEEFGKNLKYTYEVLSEEKWDEDDIAEFAQELEDYFDIDPDDVTAGYRLEVEATVKGSEDKESETDTITVVKIRDSWYMTNIFYW